MNKRTQVILWTLPLLVIFLEIFIRYIGIGLVIPWKLVGKPSEDISRIIGVRQGKLFVSTGSGELYSLHWAGDSIPDPTPWVAEKELPSDSVRSCLGEFSCTVEGGSWVASPPLFFRIKQIYQFTIGGEGGSLVYKIALSADGNIWYWIRGFSVYWDLQFYYVMGIEILGYLLALIIGFFIFLAKKII